MKIHTLILEDFYVERLEYYKKRREYTLTDLKKRLKRLTNKVKYIQGVLDDTIDLRRKSESDIEMLLLEKGLEKIDNQYHYLTKMTMDSVSSENVTKMNKQQNEIDADYTSLYNAKAETLWMSDLLDLEPIL